MRDSKFKGIVPILQMPFTNDGEIDEASLRSEVDWAIKAGADGIGTANASETSLLSEEERARVTNIVVDEVNGRVPVTICTGHQGLQVAAKLSKQAQEIGADALVVMPFIQTNVASYERYYRAVAEAVDIPIMIQDAAYPLPVSLMAKLNKEYSHVCYVKEETQDALEKMREILKTMGDDMTVLGGSGGNYIITEFLCGAKGSMPGTSLVDRFVIVYKKLLAGDVKGARDALYVGCLPLANFHSVSKKFIMVEKAVMKARGIIATTYCRSEMPLDPFLERQLIELLQYMGVIE
jgi:4-hydroxy-tetrahydrodipicolinate synthase